MLPALSGLRRSLWNMSKSRRVADEGTVTGPVNGAEYLADQRWRRFSLVYELLLAPLAVVSCLSGPRTADGPEGVWVRGEYGRVSEMNHHHLVMNDGLRYAILM